MRSYLFQRVSTQYKKSHKNSLRCIICLAQLHHWSFQVPMAPMTSTKQCHNEIQNQIPTDLDFLKGNKIVGFGGKGHNLPEVCSEIVEDSTCNFKPLCFFLFPLTKTFRQGMNFLKSGTYI